MFLFFRKNTEAIKKYLLIAFLSIVSLSMVIAMAPIGGGDTSTAQSNALASIGGATVTSQELDERIRDRFKSSSMGFDRRMVPLFAPSTLDQMVIDRILVEQAHKM